MIASSFGEARSVAFSPSCVTWLKYLDPTHGCDDLPIGGLLIYWDPSHEILIRRDRHLVYAPLGLTFGDGRFGPDVVVLPPIVLYPLNAPRRLPNRPINAVMAATQPR